MSSNFANEFQVKILNMARWSSDEDLTLSRTNQGFNPHRATSIDKLVGIT